MIKTKYEIIKEEFIKTLHSFAPWILPMLIIAYLIGYSLR